MSRRPITRRGFLRAAGALGAIELASCTTDLASLFPNITLPRPRPGGGIASGDGKVIFARSGRGRRVSRAALGYNHNMRFLTEAEADAHPAHPGDRSRVIRLVVSAAEHQRLFGGGNRVADLRLV